MNKKYNKKYICDQINNPNCIIKEERHHKNGDITVRFGELTKGGKMKVKLEDILDSIQKMDQRINQRLENIENDIVVMKKDIKLMKNTPTMKRELNLSNN